MNQIPQPSIKSLIWSCLASLLLAITVLIVAVLPAEFNIDPTGLGKKLGLTVLSQSADTNVKPVVITCPKVLGSQSLDKSLHTDDHSHENGHDHDHTHEQGHEHEQTEAWQDIVIISIPPNKGLEYKFNISKGEKFEFVWEAAGTPVYFDFHGEPETDKTGYFKSFKESTQSESSGTLLVPFSGSFGWYWENKTSQVVNITLKTRGHYKVIGFL